MSILQRFSMWTLILAAALLLAMGRPVGRLARRRRLGPPIIGGVTLGGLAGVLVALANA